MIKIISNRTNAEIKYNSFKFPGGEIQIKLEATYEKSVRICAKLLSSDEVIKLLLLTQALKQCEIKITELFIPYVPYARQDRVMDKGESLSIKVFANLINSQKYKKVMILDPHSDVTTALIDNCHLHDLSYNLLKPTFYEIRNELKVRNESDIVLVAPDAGALKKIYKSTQEAEFKGEIITCTKHRDTITGEITDTIVPYTSHLHHDKTMVIVDDICDGGRTFIEIAKKIKELDSERTGKIVLAVTHGIFSKGLEVLKEGGIDLVVTTDSFYEFDNTSKFHKEGYIKVYPIVENY